MTKQNCFYDEKYFLERYLAKLKFKPRYIRLIRYLRKQIKTGRLLEVGCGVGYFLAQAEKYFETYGIDISPIAIQYAKKNTTKSILTVGSATNLPFKNDFFNIVVALDVLEHIHNPLNALIEINRVMRPHGLLLMRIPNTASVGKKLKKEEWHAFRDPSHVSLLSREEWFSILRKSGFIILDIFYDGLWDTPYYSKIPKILQDVVIKFPSIVLFELGFRFTENLGENVHFVAMKKGCECHEEGKK